MTNDEILSQLKREMLECPKNKSGSYNGNGRWARIDRAVRELVANGIGQFEATKMATSAAPSKP